MGGRMRYEWQEVSETHWIKETDWSMARVRRLDPVEVATGDVENVYEIEIYERITLVYTGFASDKDGAMRLAEVELMDREPISVGVECGDLTWDRNLRDGYVEYMSKYVSGSHSIALDVSVFQGSVYGPYVRRWVNDGNKQIETGEGPADDAQALVDDTLEGLVRDQMFAAIAAARRYIDSKKADPSDRYAGQIYTACYVCDACPLKETAAGILIPPGTIVEGWYGPGETPDDVPLWEPCGVCSAPALRADVGWRTMMKRWEDEDPEPPRIAMELIHEKTTAVPRYIPRDTTARKGALKRIDEYEARDNFTHAEAMRARIIVKALHDAELLIPVIWPGARMGWEKGGRSVQIQHLQPDQPRTYRESQQHGTSRDGWIITVSEPDSLDGLRWERYNCEDMIDWLTFLIQLVKGVV